MQLSILTAAAGMTSEPVNDVLTAMRDVGVRTIPADTSGVSNGVRRYEQMFKDICAAIITVIAAVATIQVNDHHHRSAVLATGRFPAYSASTLPG